MRWRLFLRRAIGTIIGLIFAIILVQTFWQAAIVWFPPAVLDESNEAAVRAFVMTMPLAGQVTIAVGWFVTGLIGAYAALRVAQWRPAGRVAMALPVALAIVYWTQMTQPLWLEILSVLLPVVGAELAERHYHRARRGDPLLN